jgi:hypothetical protein
MKSLREMLPWGGLRKLAKQFDCSPTHVGNVLDGKAHGYDKIIQAAETLIVEEAKRRKEEELDYQRQKMKIINAVRT